MSLFLIISVLGRAIARMSSVTLQTEIILAQFIEQLAYKHSTSSKKSVNFLQCRSTNKTLPN
jgi:hypothetical protein